LLSTPPIETAATEDDYEGVFGTFNDPQAQQHVNMWNIQPCDREIGDGEELKKKPKKKRGNYCHPLCDRDREGNDKN
jgi:hypothetical protein